MLSQGDSLNFVFLLTSRSALLITPSLFTPLKRETEKALKTASRSLASDYLLFIHFMTKNDKLPMVKQCHFINVTPFSAFNVADVLKREQAVTHLLMLKRSFNPCPNVLNVIAVRVVRILKLIQVRTRLRWYNSTGTV